MAHNNDLVRNKLIEITNKGLMLEAIARNVGIDVNNLSRFKGGMNCLKQSDVEVLPEYLKAVVIPQWNTVVQDKSMSTRERLLASRNKQNEEKLKRKQNRVTLDLLCSLDD